MKYPRTFHLPWSQGNTADDIKLIDLHHFKDKMLIYTEKLDGENTVMSRDTIHARSEDGDYNAPWQTYVKSLWASIRHTIPEDMYICGENMYAVHSIEYQELNSHFYVFMIIRDNKVLSWPETVVWCINLGLTPVPLITMTKGIQDLSIPKQSEYGTICEGYVVRNYEEFPVDLFGWNVAKCVRENHVQTDEHWTKNWKKAEVKTNINDQED